MSSSSPSDAADPLAEIFAADGVLANALNAYQPRAVQVTMANLIAETIELGGRLVVESGTGTGKTFAYLVPIIASGQRALISTGTRHLQDQLFVRDLPAVMTALPRPIKVALLKGRANYLCRYRLAAATAQVGIHQGVEHDGTERQTHLARARRWATLTDTGDIAELSEIPDDAPVWPQITSTSENCLGTTCSEYEQCFVVKARREALAADLVVVNHHLFFADLVLKEDGFGQLLPGVDVVLFDEAHQLPDIAGVFLGASLSSRQVDQLCHDTEDECRLAHINDVATSEAIVNALKAVNAVRGGLAHLGRGSLAADSVPPGLPDRLLRLSRALVGLTDCLQAHAPASDGLAKCHQRAGALVEQLSSIADLERDDFARWFDATSRGFRLNATPLELGPRLADQFMAADKAWIFTSATLAVAGNFDHFVAPMGLADAECVALQSPFDYPRQAMMYLPRGLPDPRAENYTGAVVNAAVPLLLASRGRAFMLFTSHRALQLAAKYLAEDERCRDLTLLTQGSEGRGKLLDRFVTESNAVLLGTASFWEGVDVRGQRLSLVVIDKLPFESINDPLTRAKMEFIERRDGNPFTAHQVPRAALSLKQGVGRLIRDHDDYGLLMLADPRITTKGYGRIFLRDLPKMRQTGELAEAEAFIREYLSSGMENPATYSDRDAQS